jgi:cell wall-associated NlpC family hydrolase
MSSLPIGALGALQRAMTEMSSTAQSVPDELEGAATDPGRFSQALMSALESLGNAESALLSALPGRAEAGQPMTSAASTGSPLYGNAVGVSAYPGGVDGGDVVSDALRYLGVPYRWGGTSPTTGFDCSGFVQHVFADLGISLPRTSQEQALVGEPVSSLAQASPGDLLFFEPGPGGPGHVGIYVGNGLMVDAPHTGTAVQVQPVWTSELCCIRQVVPAGPPDGAATSGGLGYPTAASSSNAFSPGTITSAGSLLGGPAGLGPASLAISGPYASGASIGVATSPGSFQGVPPGYAQLFLQAGARYGLPPQLLAAVAHVESGFDPNAVSSAGAEGLMQLMPATAASHGVDPFDPAQAVDAAAQILASNLQQFGSLPLALAAYNAGAGAVQEYGGIPPYPQTQAYVQKVIASMETMGGTVGGGLSVAYRTGDGASGLSDPQLMGTSALSAQAPLQGPAQGGAA